MAQLLSNLPIGAKVKFGRYSVNGEPTEEIRWKVVARNHNGYPSNSVTLLTDEIIDLRSFDAREPTSNIGSSQQSGLGRYKLSNIRQWLNSNAIDWYVSQHIYDQAPNDTYTSGRTAYVNRPGFLSAFTTNEISAILVTHIISYDYQDGVVTLSDKVFFPSYREVSGTESENINLEGNRWEYFTSNSSLAKLTRQAFINSLSSTRVDPSTGNSRWMTRSTIRRDGEDRVYVMHDTSPGAYYTVLPYDGTTGVRPAMNLSASLKLSDTTDSDGCYTVVWNVAPSNPSIINVPATIYGGKSNAISWSAVSDPDGDTVTYTLECSVNGGSYAQLYRGTSTVYAHLVPFGTNSVQYRVMATDPSNASSAYTVSTSRTVVNNNAPVISGSDSNLGVKGEGFTGTYVVTDANSDTVTVTESIDGVQIRSLVVALGSTNTYGITGNTWLALPNGSHTLTIRATDGIDSSVRTYTFTKLVDSFTIRNTTPWASVNMPSRIMLVVTRNVPSGATFKVEVCNNGHDTSPTWEDATDAVRSGLVHVFSNKVKTAGQWGVLVRVTVERNGATGACYVSAIGGNFE